MDEEEHIVSFSLGRFHMKRRKVWAVAIFFFLCYYMLLPTNFGVLSAFRDSFYICVVPVLVAAVLYFRQFRDGIELKLLFVFWIWFWFSRALNGSPTLDHDFNLFFDLALMIPFLSLGLASTKEERAAFLDRLSAIIGGFYSILGLLALLAFFRQSVYYLPVSGAPLGVVPDSGYECIILSDNRNFISFCFLIALFLMIYQFFRCEKKLWRVPILLSAVLDLLVIAVLGSRSVWLCKALTFAMLAVMLLLQPLQSKPRFLRMAVVFAVAILVLVSSYKISDLGSTAMTGLSYKASKIRQTPSITMQQKSSLEKNTWPETHDSIHLTVLSSNIEDSPDAARLVSGPEQIELLTEYKAPNDVSFGRRQIWRGAFQTIKANPSILWKGHLCDNIMTTASDFVPTDGSGELPWSFYNSLIQVLMVTGLPGLFLVVFFLVRVLYRGFCFSFCVGVPLAARTLALPVVATMPYFMLEAGLFSAIDVRTLFYFLICGMMLGFIRDYQKG